MFSRYAQPQKVFYAKGKKNEEENLDRCVLWSYVERLSPRGPSSSPGSILTIYLSSFACRDKKEA